MPTDKQLLRQVIERVGALERQQRQTKTVEEPSCPTCFGIMEIKRNSFDLSKFWGCIRWPRCWGTRDSPDVTRDRGRKIERQSYNRCPYCLR